MRHFVTISCAALLGSAAIAAEPAVPITPGAADRSQEIVCRKDKETGSLVKTKKTCHSRAQWNYIDDTNQQFSRQMADDMRTKPGGQ